MRGRKPKPTAQKILEGNPGRRPLNKQEPKPELAAPDCPPSLSKEARDWWNQIITEMLKVGTAAKMDVGVISVHCDALARRDEAVRKLRREGQINITPFGKKLNPWNRVLKDAEAAIMKSAAELGLTASSRTRIKVEPKKPDGPFDQFQKRRAQIHLLKSKRNADKNETKAKENP